MVNTRKFRLGRRMGHARDKMKKKLLSTKLELSTEMVVSGLEVSSEEAIPNLAGQHDEFRQLDGDLGSGRMVCSDIRRLRHVMR